MSIQTYNVGDKFINPAGGIESILFASDSSLLLSGDDETLNERLIDKSSFEKELLKQNFIEHIEPSVHLELTEYQKDSIEHWKMYLEELKLLVDDGLKPTPLATYQRLIEVVESKQPATIAGKHPGKSTVCDKWKLWSKKFDDNVLAGKKRNCPTRLTKETEAFLIDYVATVFSSSNTNYAKAIYASYVAKAKLAAQSDSRIKIASERTFRRRLNNMRENEHSYRMQNLTEQERNKRLLTLQRSIKTYYAMQRVECDRVCINMSLIDDETGKPTPTLSLYCAIDTHTRCIVGVVLSFDSENKVDVLNLIRQIYMSDDNLIMCGKPVNVIIDNGPGFNNAAIQKACSRLGINLVYAPSNQPAKKPFIESFFNVLRKEFFQGMDIETKSGFTIGFNSYNPKNSVSNQETYLKAQKKADVKVSDFIYLLNKFLSEYHAKRHLEANLIPRERWRTSLLSTPRTQFNYEMVKEKFHIFSDGKKYRLQSNGVVNALNCKFSSDATKNAYKLLKKRGMRNENPQVMVHYDPHDITQITITFLDPVLKKEVEVTAYNKKFQDSTTPISQNDLSKELVQVEDRKLKSCGIFIEQKHTLDHHYTGSIKELKRAKRGKTPRRGKSVHTFDENNEKNLTIEERIAQSQRLDNDISYEKRLDKRLLNVDENNAKETNKVISNKQTPDDEDYLW